MIKSLWYITMAWVIILNSMVYSVICVNYQLNKTFISEYFCVNKDVPLSQCQGQCFLGKQLDAAAEQENAQIEFRADFNVFMLATSLCFWCNQIAFSPVKYGGNPLLPNYQADLASSKKPPKI
jgi:hypothetical protein